MGRRIKMWRKTELKTKREVEIMLKIDILHHYATFERNYRRDFVLTRWVCTQWHNILLLFHCD